MTSLFVRLSSVFLIILLLFAAFSLWIADHSTRAYFLESTQQLNAPVAMYMANNVPLVSAGEVDVEALAHLAELIMIINPSVELYLLDTEGNVTAQAANANSIARIKVDLEPVKRFLAASEEGVTRTGAMLGDNPMNLNEKRAFSASPLIDEGKTIGYVYVVLAGKQHQSILSSIGTSYSVRNLAMMLAGVLVMACLGGFFVFFTLTRSLRSLTHRVQRWQTCGFGALAFATSHPAEGVASMDEIEELTRAYDAMTLKLQDQYQELQFKDKTRRELIANISHDLRTPLTTLQGYLETVLLKHGQLDDALEKRYLTIAHRHGSRLRDLVAQLFDLSKLDSGDVPLHSERFSLLELAHDAMQDIDMRARQRSVGLSVVARESDNSNFDVMADISLIHRVFENLLDNALRYTPDNGDVVIALASLAGDRISVTVSDTGCGMSQADAQRVFEPRFTSGGTRTEADQHAGLGLAIVRSIVSLHESTISVNSEPDMGTSFTFALPAALMPAVTDSESVAVA